MVSPPETGIETILREFPEYDHRAADILWTVGLWYSAAWFERGDWWLHIGFHKPPDLRRLLECSPSTWEGEYRPVLEDLQERGLLKERYIMRRKCKWAPTRAGRALIGEAFGAELLNHCNHHVDNPSQLVGDWMETLLHRTGVEIMQTALNAVGYYGKTYGGRPGTPRPDLHFSHTADGVDLPGGKPWNVEILTDHNDHKMPERKYQNFSDVDKHALWIFEDRKHAIQTLNRLHESTEVDCLLVNAPYRNPENYSLSVVNRYIDRSIRDAEYTVTGINQIGTITGWFERHVTEDYRRSYTYKPAMDDDVPPRAQPDYLQTV